MGKHHRHKKALKVDKAKTKLKQTKTKFLPKGQNVTNTTFKIKPIVLAEQLKEKDKSLPLSKRKLDVKDLLSRARHYNENVRQHACDDLTEMMKFYSDEIVNHHLSQIIPVISSLMQDREVKVRKSVTKVLSSILTCSPEHKLKPYYKYFQINLRCAMTNIDRNIQEDSLTFLEIFLKSNSNFIFGDPTKFLPDFLTLIAKLRTSDNVGLTLTMNLESRISSITWRIKVMNQLGKILKKFVVKPQKPEQKNVIYTDWLHCVTLYNSEFLEKLESSWNSWNFAQNQDCKSLWDSYLVNIIPILCDTLMEVMPDKRSENSFEETTHLHEVTSIILYIVISIFSLLYNYAESNNLTWKSDVFNKTMQHLMANFPYNFTGNISNEIKKLHLDLAEINHVNFNLMLCSLSLPLFSSKRSVKDLNRMMDYLNKCLLNKKLTVQKSSVLLTNLKIIYNNFQTYWKLCDENLQKLLENTLIFFNNLTDNNCIIDCFDMLLNLHHVSFVKDNAKYKSWLGCLPNLLCRKEITKLNVEMLLKASKMNVKDFHLALLEKLPNILDHLDSNLKENVINDDYVQTYLPMLFLYVEKLREDDVTVIKKFIVKHESSKYAKNFQKMIEWRQHYKMHGGSVDVIQYY